GGGGGGRPPIIIEHVISVGQEASDFNVQTVRIDGRETVASSQRCDLHAMGVQKGIRQHDKAAIRLACLCGKRRFEFGSVVNRCCNRFHAKGCSGGFEGVRVIFKICRRCRVEQEGDSVDARRNLLEQL